jgi:hypothetical protein
VMMTPASRHCQRDFQVIGTPDAIRPNELSN